MRKPLKTLIYFFSAMALLLTQGCAVVYFDKDVAKLTDNTVFRMKVAWHEDAAKGVSPVFYNASAKVYHWGPNAAQYRWVFLDANIRRDMFAKMLKNARIADSIPILETGDYVDVLLPPEAETNYDELHAAIVIRFVCKNADTTCKDKSKAELHGAHEVVSRTIPDISGLRFTKKFDPQGRLLNTTN